MTQYSLCETVTAGSKTPWHIRVLTKKGRKLGGGADSSALCGKKVSWDLESPVDKHLDNCCGNCKEIYATL